MGGNEERHRPNLTSVNPDIKLVLRWKTKAKYTTQGLTRSRKGLTRSRRDNVKEKLKATSQKAETKWKKKDKDEDVVGKAQVG